MKLHDILSETNMQSIPPMPPHWYKFYSYECPICGRRKEYVERVYGLRPEHVDDTVHYETIQCEDCTD
jgi:hypothetical protein